MAFAGLTTEAEVAAKGLRDDDINQWIAGEYCFPLVKCTWREKKSKEKNNSSYFAIYRTKVMTSSGTKNEELMSQCQLLASRSR